MKKGLRWFIIFALVITGILYFINTNYEITTDEKGEKTIVKTDKETSMDLTAWLALYQSGSFDKVKIVNDTILEGYQQEDKQGNVPLMSLQSNVKVVYYNIFSAQKPATTSLKDLGISLTGSTAISSSLEEQNVWSKLLMENILPMIFFLLVALFLFRMMSPK